MCIGYIYSITNLLNGHMYIGKTNNLKRRWNQHKSGRGGTTILSKAINKYGLENFLFDIIAEIPFESSEELNSVLSQLEVYYIELYGTLKDGYNATYGGEGGTIDYSKIGVSDKKREACKKNGKKYADKVRGIPRNREVIMRGALKRRKPVLQYDIHGNFIREYPMLSAVSNFESINIGKCCKGEISSAYGYIWKYKESDEYPLIIKAPVNWHKANIPIIQCNLNGEIIKEYNSATEASKITGIGRKSITNCLGGWSNTGGGYIWKYKEGRRNEI